MGRFLFPACRENPDLERHARLIVWFGLLGASFEFLYAVFYALIGHLWGMWIVAASGLCALATPFILKYGRTLFWSGHLLLAIMTTEFILLCTIEGGLHGHAFAWLVCIPLCALLLAGKRGAIGWTVISLLVGAAISIAAISGVDMQPTYDPKWEALVSSIGYLGLIIFMFCLGLIFEIGREKAIYKMRDALAQLQESNEQLIELNREKNEFLGIAAHDMKNPLTGIMGNAEMLRFCDTPEKISRNASNIIASCQRLLSLIKNLLDTQAIEEGRLTARIERCNLALLAVQSIENNLPYSRQKQIELDFSGQEEVWVRVDRGATLQILDNLISNAVKYSPSGTTVKIQTTVDASRGEIVVCDQGPGISADEQKLLFQKFTRLSTQPTAGESSSGLGLSIVKRLAEAMSGTVSCQSTLGEGCTFRVVLPLWEVA